MREIAEFRIDEHFASMLFADNEGERVGDSVRKIQIATSDPRFADIGRLQRELREGAGKPFFYGWTIRRKYDRHELETALLLRLRISSVFEPAGEECGTKYDEASACPRCGSGSRQTGPLFLDAKRIPKGKDVCETIAGEIVVSRRVVELVGRHGITGAELTAVRTNPAMNVESADWFQLAVQHVEAEIVPPTRVGIDPFDDDSEGECRCPLGDLIGLNQLSEVSISAASRGDSDIVGSRQFIGTRRGLLRPRRVLFASPRMWKLIESEKLRGFEVQVAYLA